jgi:hypothetical protein
MRRQVTQLALGVVLAVGISGCVTEKTVLTNAAGNTIECDTSGRIGIISGWRLHEQHHECIAKAEANGYHVQAAAANSP